MHGLLDVAESLAQLLQWQISNLSNIAKLVQECCLQTIPDLLLHDRGQNHMFKLMNWEGSKRKLTNEMRMACS